ncbi:MAG: EAL domain-containing protein [Methylococcales bacterium]|nr:MAG: EAL domain-containing protein [Methylococcales bacterium]
MITSPHPFSSKLLIPKHFLSKLLFVFLVSSFSLVTHAESTATPTATTTDKPALEKVIHLDLTESEQRWLADHPAIRVAVNPNKQPYDWVDEQGQFVGMAADYLKLLEQKLGIHFSIVKPGASLADILDMVKHGEVDMLAGVVISEERTQYLNFLKPYVNSPNVIVDADKHLVDNLEQLNGKVVAVEKAYVIQEWLKRDYPSIKLFEANDALSSLWLVETGQADAYVGDIATINYWLKKEGLSDLKISGQTDYRSNRAIAISKQLPELSSIMNKASLTINQTEIDDIPHHWFSLQVEPGYNKTKVLISFDILMALITALFSYWTYRLKIEIKKRKQLEAELIASENRFKFLANEIPVLTWMSDTNKLQYWFNSTWLEFTGQSLEQAIGLDWGDCIHPEDFKPLMEVYNTNFDKRLPFRTEYRLRCADGDYRWMNAEGVPQYSDSGEFQGYVGSCVDITELRNSKAATKILAMSPLNVANEMIYTTNLKGIILDCNQRFCDVTGYTKEKAIGRDVRILKSGKHKKDFYTKMWQQIIDQGHWRGEITNRHKAGNFITLLTSISTVYDDRGNPKRYVAVATDVSSTVERRQQLEKLAYYDNLTGLANRSLLMDRLKHAMSQVKRRGGFIAVLFVDLDGFKAINDHYGHDVGDEFLVAISQKMKTSLRDTDTIARLGGDEFVIILDELSHQEDLDAAIPKILKACCAEIVLRGLKLRVSASIGGSLYPSYKESYDIDPETLVIQADQAMYVAKKSGKNSFHLFEADQDQVIVTRNNAIEAINLGLIRGEFELYYQPVVNMRTGVVLGFEALIRWNKPQTGILKPSRFMPLVQNNPLGIKLGNWVIKSALTQLAEWQKQGKNFTISVNVDARQLMQANFIEDLKVEINKLANFKPGSLVLETLETFVIEDPVKVKEVISQCHAIGVDFSLDDFGTGYSSIVHLKELPFKNLKIDRSFIKGITESAEDFKLVSHITHLATDMRKQVIAEGVETLEQGKILLGFGCEHAQGYAISKPMMASSVLEWLNMWIPYSAWLKAPRSDRNYHLLFDKMADPMLVIKQGRIVDCNTAAVRFLNHPYKESLLNKLTSDISPLLQADGQRSDDKAKIINEATKKTGSQSVEWLHLRADGTEVLVEARLTAIKLEDEDIIQVIWRDLSLVA